MGNFDKKRAFGIGGVLTGLAAVIAVAANISEIVQLFRGDDKPEVSTSARTQIVEEVSEETVVEQADVIEAKNIAEVVEEVPPTEAQPTVVYLNSLKVAQSGCFYEDEIYAEDTIGNTYIENIMKIGTGYSDECYAMYYLGGKYKTLSGIIAVHDGTDNDYSGQIAISADANVIYTTDEMGRASVPIEFSVNIENCNWLKINKFGSTFNGKGAWFILADWKLE